MYDSRFGVRQKGTGAYADLLAQGFAVAAKRLGLERRGGGVGALDCAQFSVPEVPGTAARATQLALF